jgi:energy-coupling factor transporter ATP-binding protein EcfA2
VGVSYADAARLLGGSESKIVSALDHLTGGLLLAATAAGSGFALSLFAARDEVVRLSGELLAGLQERMRGLDRFGRSERLAAAHAVVVLVAYFDALADVELPFDARELELTSSEQVMLATAAGTPSGRLRALAEVLLRAEVPMPVPQRPYEVTLEALGEYYVRLSDRLLEFVSGLAVYEKLNETRRQNFSRTVSQSVPDRAVARYEESFRRLAAEFPEFAVWASLVDQQATREEIRQLRSGLEDLELALLAMASGRDPDERRAALWRAYRAALGQPILGAGMTDGLTVPSLAAAYVNPAFRVAVNGPAQRLGEESTWADEPVRIDLTGFLAGYLTAPTAIQGPLLILGQPGSGKSVLTQMMAARMPPDQFMGIRVVLRDVAADEEVQAQIEHAVRTATGESLTWPELSRSAGDALPVVLLDGFDELLQATGVSQADYLKKAAAFQEREAIQGRPVAVVVTSRTAVADRAQPTAGTVVLRLEPFREDQVSQWLQAWNRANADGFARRGVRPLPLPTVLAHAELAAQPLLLTMLALFDASANQLQHLGASLGTADLYDRLLVGFAAREVERTGAVLAADELDQAIERELERLSLAAFAMFNRGLQWVAEADLDSDLAVLFSPPDGLPRMSTLRAPLSAAQTTLGRFFFIYEAQATRDGTRLRTYEFLHATFGEYLIARLVAKELGDLAESNRPAAARRPTPADDAFLHAILSFIPLTMRGTVVSFLAERLQELPGERRDVLQSILLELFYDALRPRHDTRYSDYEPLELPVPARYAAYTANLLLLTVLNGRKVNGSTLFPRGPDVVHEWRNLALLWRSQLPAEGWSGLTETVAVERIWEDNKREVILRWGRERDTSLPHYDYLWAVNCAPDDYRRNQDPVGYGQWSIWTSDEFDDIRRRAHFTGNRDDDTCVHALEPLADHLGGSVITSFHSYWHDRSVSPANALISLWLASSQDSSAERLTEVYDTCLRISLHGSESFDALTRKRFRAIFFWQLSADHYRLPRSWLELAAQAIKRVSEDESHGNDGQELMQMALEMAPKLMGSPS